MVTLNLSELGDLVVGAAFLRERIDGHVHCGEGTDPTGESLFERWRKNIIGRGEEEQFAARLRFDGLKIISARRLFNRVTWKANQPFPSWAHELNRLLELLPLSLADIRTAVHGKVFLQDVQVPFEQAWAPMLIYAETRLQEVSECPVDILTDDAVGLCLRQLLVLCSNCFGGVLYSSWRAWRFRDSPLSVLLEKAPFPKKELKGYRTFVQWLLTGGWKELFIHYPVLARVLLTLIENWCDALCQFCRRLKEDRRLLIRLFFAGQDPGKITRLEMGLSDRHYGARTVYCASFEDKRKLVYKPRPFDVEIAWESFLREIDRDITVDFKTPRILQKEDYGWVEWIESTPLRRIEEAKQYYRKAGMALCLVYFLGGTDFHEENIIATQGGPVLIDLETLLLPLVRPYWWEGAADPSGGNKLNEGIDDTVMRTMMLPIWEEIASDTFRDYSGLTPQEDPRRETLGWVNINKDMMDIGPTASRQLKSLNCPHLNDRVVPPQSFFDGLLEGFEIIYDFITANRETVLSLLNKFKGCWFRFLSRNTQIYTSMIERLCQPQSLRSGVSFSIEIERLAQAYLTGVPEERREALWSIFTAERESLEQLDVPVFYVKAADHGLYDRANLIIKDYFLVSALQNATMLVGKANLEDKKIQVQYITSSLGATPLLKINEGIRPDEGGKSLRGKGGREWDDEELFTVAIELADEIVAHSITSGELVSWIVRQFDPGQHRLIFKPVDLFLYEGKAGIGLFLAAMAKQTAKERYRILARGCFHQIFDLKQEQVEILLKNGVGFGYAGGLGGVIRALRLSGKLLEDNRISVQAYRLASIFTPGLASQDAVLDIVGGSSGTILGLLDCYSDTGDKVLLKAAEAFGEHLLGKRVLFEGRKLWRSVSATQPLAGFGHGMSGFAYALLRLSDVTGREDFYASACEALDYEKSVFSPEHKNWPDFRKNKEQTGIEFMGGWCSGAPGIGLARLAALPFLDNQQIRTDIENALEYVLSTGMESEKNDHLCCGHASGIDFLIEAAVQLNRPELFGSVREYVSRMITRAQKKGRFSLNTDIHGPSFSPGFFSGTSGIGYIILRTVVRGELPSLLY